MRRYNQKQPSGLSFIIFFIIVAICFTLMQKYPLSKSTHKPVYNEPADIELWDIQP